MTDSDTLCGNCNGSGEGQFDGSHCNICGGSGVAKDYDAEYAAKCDAADHYNDLRNDR